MVDLVAFLSENLKKSELWERKQDADPTWFVSEALED